MTDGPLSPSSSPATAAARGLGANGIAAGADVSPARRPAVAPAAPETRDGFREIVETVVFVVVLVLLLKSFVAEAFVIPTGSMATTLWGYQKLAECPQCGYRFPVNCSDEGQGKSLDPVVGGTCPNCHYEVDFKSRDLPPCRSGDRVLVAKYFYDSGLVHPRRLDVVVFKFPERPQENYEAMNYIKRLIGLPGETIGIRYGKLYVLTADKGPQYDDSAVRAEDRWHQEYTHMNEAVGLLTMPGSPFTILRKPPRQVLALRRIVYDNDHPAADLPTPRWVGDGSASAWSVDEDHGFRHADAGDGVDWLRYRHVLRSGKAPELITDFLGYNTETTRRDERGWTARNWVGDLLVECDVTVEKAAGGLVLELSKGPDRFRARWDLGGSGVCTLTRVTDGRETELARQAAPLAPGRAHRVRFANVDDRLLVWVDGKLPFGDGQDYTPSAKRGPTVNDLQPAGIGVTRGAAVRIRHLSLWRDTYYTVAANSSPSNPDYTSASAPDDLSPEQFNRFQEAMERLRTSEGWSDPDAWEPLRHLPAKTMYVQPGHYLCMGDNSPKSADSRSWGTVPERLLLGRALMVYYPFYIPYLNPENRVGLIR